jgi:hypothetical protein
MAKRLAVGDTPDVMYRLCNAFARLPSTRALIAAVVLALALMSVLLASGDALRSRALTQDIAAANAGSIDPAAVERVAPEPRGRPVVIAPSPTPAPTEEPTPAPTVAPVPVAPAPVAAAARVVAQAAPPAPAACPATFFCYPRLGIAGAIVPYNDCSGTTEVGSAIRQLTCVRAGIWLAGHAYTQFGGIANYGVGDVVIVRGQSFTVTGATVQRACAPATGPTAPLSLQTSLDNSPCGRVLVVQAR